MTQKSIPACELIATIYQRNAEAHPDLRLTTNDGENAIAFWSEELQKWCTCAAWAITDQWAEYPYEMRVNGEPLIKAWIEVPRVAEVHCA